MKGNNLVKTLIIIIIILSMGIVGMAVKLIVVEKDKLNQDASIIIDKTPVDIKEPVTIIPPKEEPVVEEPVIDEEPIEKDPIVEKPKEEKPPIKDPIQEKTPDKKDDDKVIVSPKYISKDEAISIGLKKVGVGAILVEIDVELDDNPPKYELEIILGNYEYELEIHAITGAIIDFEKDEID